MRRLLVLVLVSAALTAGCASNGRDASTPPVSVSAAPAAPTTAIPTGYEAIVLRVTDPAGAVHEWCVLVADTEAKRERGLMNVDNLGGYDGMLFTFDSPTGDSFYMFQTRLPLSIAFFAKGGGFVSSADMPPCTASHGGDCPLYPAKAPYVDALEVPMGGLGALSVGAGSSIATGPKCERAPA